MPNDPYATIIADCDAATEAAEAAAYDARHKAIMSVLDGAEPWDEMKLLAWFAGAHLSGFCPHFRAEARADFLEMMDRATAIVDEADDPDGDEVPDGATVN